ncbi:unnamed protein product [Polarella glacialis]|uniref:Protein kinase domain-containing protein n=1 Tax=Polarella glacialis TaxID=89957 RepID=A0A813J0X1_POLGL|nr:unnamed protein product [Polarella glacialis]
MLQALMGAMRRRKRGSNQELGDAMTAEEIAQDSLLRSEAMKSYKAASDREAEFWVSISVVGMIGYLVLYLIIVKTLKPTYNFVPVFSTSVAIATHGLGWLWFKCERRRGDDSPSRHVWVSMQTWQAAAFILNSIISASINPSVQMQLYPNYSSLHPLAVFGPPALCIEPHYNGYNGNGCLDEGDGPLIAQILFQSYVIMFVLLVLRFPLGLFGGLVSMTCYCTIRALAVRGLSPESNPFSNMVTIAFVSYLQLIMVLFAKWKLERSQRQLFYELACKGREVVEEKILRCNAEFAWETAQTGLKAAEVVSDDTVSRASRADLRSLFTESSNACFEVKVGDPETWTPEPKVGDLMRLGQREHWLLHLDDLELEPRTIIGQGTYATVLLGKAHGMQVAVKQAKSFDSSAENYTASLEYLQTHINELRVLRHARHPNIVHFHGAVFMGKLGVALVMEYVNGPSMSKFIQRDISVKLPFPELTPHIRHSLLLGIASALWYLHKRNPSIVHGDMKPDNICVESPQLETPRPKLLDFGLSRVLSSAAQKLGGTVRWMAPEVLLGGAPARAAADVFSYGRLIYFTSTGQTPLKGLELSDIFQAATVAEENLLTWPQNDPYVQVCAGIAQPCLNVAAELRPEMSLVFRNLQAWAGGAGCEDVVVTVARPALSVPYTTRCVPRQLESVVESEPSAEKSQFTVTPRNTRLMMILDAIERWHNAELGGLSSEACCKPHHSVLELQKDIERLCGANCDLLRPRIDESGDNYTAQCASCFALCDSGVLDKNFQLRCDVCGTRALAILSSPDLDTSSSACSKARGTSPMQL